MSLVRMSGKGLNIKRKIGSIVFLGLPKRDIERVPAKYDRQAVFVDYLNGMSLESLQWKHKAPSIEQITKILREYGVTRCPLDAKKTAAQGVAFEENRKDTIASLRMMNDHLTYQEIADKVGATKNYVMKVCRERNCQKAGTVNAFDSSTAQAANALQNAQLDQLDLSHLSDKQKRLVRSKLQAKVEKVTKKIEKSELTIADLEAKLEVARQENLRLVNKRSRIKKEMENI